MIDLRNKRVVVVGLGTSGLAAARLCMARGAHVVLNDSKLAVPATAELVAKGAVEKLGGHSGVGIETADLVVVSPGVPSFPELEAAVAAGVPVIGEVELATSALRHASPLVAVGGTNGKSTVTSLLGELLATSNRHVFTGGNLGEPLADHVDERFDFVVLEVSSFQMERVSTFAPRASILLNVTPDHLDRYDGMSSYANAKGNAFVAQTPADLAVVPYGDEVCLAQAKRGKARIVTFGTDPRSDVYVTDAQVLHRGLGRSLSREHWKLRGGHNALNVAASLAVAFDLGIDASEAEAVLARFEGLAHRMAFVAEKKGVRFYDDSKGTNVGASVTALRGLSESKAVMILGGKDKGGSYGPLVEALREKARAAVLIGEATPIIADAIGDAVPVSRATDMADAVAKAAALASPGDAVLLSPACSSFDMFRDYKERGDVFVAAVNALEGASSR